MKEVNMKKLNIAKKVIENETTALPCSCDGACHWDSPKAKKITKDIRNIYLKKSYERQDRQMAS